MLRAPSHFILWKGQEGIKMGSIVEAAIYEYIGKFFLIFVVVPVGIMVLGYIISIRDEQNRQKEQPANRQMGIEKA